MPNWNGWDTDPVKFKPESGREVKDDGTTLDVPAWREAVQSSLEGTRTIISSVHSRVHQGQAFMAFANDSTLGNTDTLNIKVTTGTTAPHMVFDVHAKLDFEFKIYEAPASSGGTSITAFNKNRVSATTSTLTLVSNTGSISGGTTILHDLISEGHKVGGNVDFDRELILKTSTDYVFEITSLAGSNMGHINLEWYEPT